MLIVDVLLFSRQLLLLFIQVIVFLFACLLALVATKLQLYNS